MFLVFGLNLLEHVRRYRAVPPHFMFRNSNLQVIWPTFILSPTSYQTFIPNQVPAP